MIDLNTFILEEFDKRNFDHRYIARVLSNDPEVRSYISPDLERFINELKMRGKEINDPLVNWYVAYLKQEKSDNIPVGMIACDKGVHYQIDYCLLPDKRGENLALMLLQQFSYYLVDDLGIDEVYGIINPSNVPSINTALKVGFERKSKSTYTLKGKRS